MPAASRGPLPKASAERRRRNAGSETQVVPVAGPVEAPPLEGDHTPLAREWYYSLKTSGQAQFYEPSDWVAAKLVAEMMTRLVKTERTSAQLFLAVWSAMGELLSTEGSRRRLRLEIERAPVEKPQNVTDYRARLVKGGRRVG